MSFEENGSSYIETIYSIRIADTLKYTPISYNSSVTWLLTLNFRTRFFSLFYSVVQKLYSMK